MYAPPARRGNVAGQHLAQARTSCWPAAAGAGRAPAPDRRRIPDRRRRAQRGGGHGHHQLLAHLLRQLGARPVPRSSSPPGRRPPPCMRRRRAAATSLANTSPRHAPAAGRPPPAPDARRHLIAAGSPIAAGARSAAVATAITSCWPTCSASSAPGRCLDHLHHQVDVRRRVCAAGAPRHRHTPAAGAHLTI